MEGVEPTIERLDHNEDINISLEPEEVYSHENCQKFSELEFSSEVLPLPAPYQLNEKTLGVLDEDRPFDMRSLWDKSRLQGGFVFTGDQSSNGAIFAVEVHLQDVNFSEGTCTGHMTVQGISDEIKILKTFFTGQIIGKHHEFLTSEWGATDVVDRKHWRRFSQFEPLNKAFCSGKVDYDNIDYEDCVFMRWKERFLAEDHTKVSVRGASFSGFYYVCYNCHDSSIKGFYYHKDSDWFQSLHLKREPVTPFGPTFEFC